MSAIHRISTIERMFPDQWVVVEVTRISRAYQPLAGRVLARSEDEDEITHEAIKARQERPTAYLWTFYTGARIPEGMSVVLGRV